jgi:hypothetical protein
MTRIKDRYGQMAKGRMASLELRQKRARARATELAPVIVAVRHRKGVERPRHSDGDREK